MSSTDELTSTLGPLGAREARRAIAAAVRESGTDRLRVLGAELVFEKPDRGQVPVRLVDVVVSDPVARRILSVLVDRSGAVVREEILDYQPAFQPDEIADARAIAERDPRAKAVARRRQAFVTVFSPASDHGESPGRVIGLRYAVPGRRGTVATAIAAVDLWAGELVSFELVGGRESG